MNDFLAAKTKFSTLQEALDFGMTTDYVNEVTGKYVYDHLESNRDINDKEINENQDMWVYITTDSKSTPIFVTKSLYKYDPNLKRNFGLVQTSLKRSEYRFKNGLLVNDVSYYLIENNITGTEDHGDKIIKYSIIFKRISPPSKADDEIYLK